MKTLKVSRREAKLLDLGRFPNAGPHPNVMGMKMKWAVLGKPQDVLCVTDGTYLYHVDEETYKKIQEV